jgi:hypothetical protein
MFQELLTSFGAIEEPRQVGKVEVFGVSGYG